MHQAEPELPRSRGCLCRLIAAHHATSQHVCVPGVPDHRETLDQLLDSLVQGVRRTEPSSLDFFVGNDIVAFVGIFANGRLKEDKRGYVLLNALAELELAEVGLAQADVVRTAHGVEILEGMGEGTRTVTDMTVVPLRMRL